MPPVWIVRLEVLAYIDSAPTEGKLGFIHVVVGASDADEARSKVVGCFEEYEWKILGIEDVSIADPDTEYGGDLNELIEDVLAHPSHILLSTLHSYKPN